MVLESLRRAYLEHKLKKVKGAQREGYIREIGKINAKEQFEAQAKEIQTKAYREEELKQAARLGSETAKIQTQRKLEQIKKTGGQQGFLAGLDKFLAGTGVAKGTSKVVGTGGLFGGGNQRVDIIGGRSSSGGFNPVTGYRAPAPQQKVRRVHRRRRPRYKMVRVRV